MALEEIERRHILKVLERTGGKIWGKDGAAALLRIHHNALHSKMKELDIIRNSKAYMYVANA